MNILVCGGAGYIGSHMVRALLNAGHQVSVFDNLSTGYEWSIPEGVFLLQADLLNEGALASFLGSQPFDAVMHFSAKSLVGESVDEPHEYYLNNVVGTLNLLRAMRKANIDKFCLLYTSPSPRDLSTSRMPSSA